MNPENRNNTEYNTRNESEDPGIRDFDEEEFRQWRAAKKRAQKRAEKQRKLDEQRRQEREDAYYLRLEEEREARQRAERRETARDLRYQRTEDDREQDRYRRTRGSRSVSYGEEEAYRRRRINMDGYSERRRRHPFLRFLRFVFFLLLIAVIFAGVIGNHLLNKMDHVEPVADEAADEHAAGAGVSLAGGAGVMNILLIGTDARSGQSGQRSDSMILCTINVRRGTISLTSLMRDMYVPIPGYDSNRLNAAHRFGGMELLDETIQENFGVDINGNAEVDFDGFLEAITSVGNLDMYLTREEADYLNANPNIGSSSDVADETWHLTEGNNSLTPSQALAYCRMRHVGNSDWERTERQRKLLSALLSKFKHSGPRTQYRMLASALPHITTDMTNLKMMKAAVLAVLCIRGDMESHLLPAEGTYSAKNINGASVLVPDLEANRARLREYMGI